MTVEDSSQLPSSHKMTMVEAASGAPTGGPDTVHTILRTKSTQELLNIARRPDVPDDGFDAVVEVIRDRWAGVVASGAVDGNLLRQEVEHVVATSTNVGEASRNLRAQANEAEQEAINDARYTQDNHGMVAGAVFAVRETISASQVVAEGTVNPDSVRRMDRAARIAAAFEMDGIDFSVVGQANPNLVGGAQQTAGPVDIAGVAAAVQEGYVRAFSKDRLTADAAYESWLNDWEWFNKASTDVNEVTARWWVSLPTEEREQYKHICELARGAAIMRTQPDLLSNFRNNTELKGVTEAELAEMYRMPGVRTALEEYVVIVDTDFKLEVNRGGKRKNISIFEATSRDELKRFRQEVRGRVYEQLMDQYARGALPQSWLNQGLADDPEGFLALKARESEQLGYMMHWVGNFFADSDSVWEGNVRVRGPRSENADLVGPLGEGMKPMDTLLAQLPKPANKFSSKGPLSTWSYNHAGGRKFDKVRLLDDSDVGKSWTMSGSTLNAPACYPTELLGSLWSESEVGGKTLLDYFRAREEAPIDQVPDVVGSYLRKQERAGTLWEFVQGRVTDLKYDGGARAWAATMQDKLGKLGRRDEIQIAKWAVYATYGVKPKERQPHLNLGNQGKKQLELTYGPKGVGLFQSADEMFLPGDGVGLWY